jgi:hypothetical protein
MNVLDQASALDNNKRISIKPLEEKRGRGRPRKLESEKKNRPKTEGVEKHVITPARAKGLKKAQVMRSIKAEEKRKAKASEQISKSNMFPKDSDNFLDYTDENHDESKILMNPEMVVNPQKPKPYSDGKNQIDQYEQKLQELGKQYTSEIDGLKQQIDRLMSKPKRTRKKKELPTNDNVVNGEGDVRQGSVTRDVYDNNTMNKHSSIFNVSPFQHIHAFHKGLSVGKGGVGPLTSQAPIQENGFQARF